MHPNMTTCEFQVYLWNRTIGKRIDKLYYTGITGTTVASAGLVLNILLATVFLQRSMRSVNGTILLALGILDICICIEFIMIFTVEAFAEQFGIIELHFLWLSYIREMYVLARATQVMSSLVIIWATLERCLAITAGRAWNKYSTQKNARLLLFGTLVFSIGSRIIMYWDVVTGTCPENGDAISSRYVDQGELPKNDTYKFVYVMFFSYFVLIVVPFLILLALNLRIIASVNTALKHQKLVALMVDSMAEQKREALRSTTKSLIVVSCSYLVCYSLQFLIAILELADKSFLDTHRNFYMYSRETINFLTVLNSTSRFFIYYFTNMRFKDTTRRLCTLVFCGRSALDRRDLVRLRRGSSISSPNEPVTNGYIERKDSNLVLEPFANEVDAPDDALLAFRVAMANGVSTDL